MWFRAIFLCEIQTRPTSSACLTPSFGAWGWSLRPRLKVSTEQEFSKMDIFVLAIGVIFFALCFAYVKACDIL